MMAAMIGVAGETTYVIQGLRGMAVRETLANIMGQVNAIEGLMLTEVLMDYEFRDALEPLITDEFHVYRTDGFDVPITVMGSA